MSNEVDAFLEHFGVRGQKWGIRNSSNTIRKKAKTVATFIKVHKEAVGAITAGAAFAGTILVDKNLKTSHPTKAISVGKSWLDVTGSGHNFLNTNADDLSKAREFTRLLHS